MNETTRRTVLTSAAGAGAAVLLGACDPNQLPGGLPSGSPSGVPYPSDEPEPSGSAAPSGKPSESPSESGEPSASPSDTADPEPTKTAEPEPSPSDTAEPTPSKTTPTTPANAIARKGDIPVGGGKVFEKEKVVITQPKAGDFKAFSAVCTHQGCLVASVKKNVINCPCHGAKYNAADGSVQGGPAPKPLAGRTVKVVGDGLVLD